MLQAFVSRVAGGTTALGAAGFSDRITENEPKGSNTPDRTESHFQA